MISQRFMLVASAFALLGASPEAVQAPEPRPSPRLYAVVLGVLAAPDGQIRSIRVAKVLEPATGTTDAVQINVPEAYLRDARAKLSRRAHKPELENGQPKEFFTYFYYDPSRPMTALDELPE